MWVYGSASAPSTNPTYVSFSPHSQQYEATLETITQHAKPYLAIVQPFESDNGESTFITNWTGKAKHTRKDEPWSFRTNLQSDPFVLMFQFIPDHKNKFSVTRRIEESDLDSNKVGDALPMFTAAYDCYISHVEFDATMRSVTG